MINLEKIFKDLKERGDEVIITNQVSIINPNPNSKDLEFLRKIYKEYFEEPCDLNDIVLNNIASQKYFNYILADLLFNYLAHKVLVLSSYNKEDDYVLNHYIRNKASNLCSKVYFNLVNDKIIYQYDFEAIFKLYKNDSIEEIIKKLNQSFKENYYLLIENRMLNTSEYINAFSQPAEYYCYSDVIIGGSTIFVRDPKKYNKILEFYLKLEDEDEVDEIIYILEKKRI